MRPRPGGDDPSLAAPRRDRDDARDAALVASVLDALPSPTVLIDGDGTMLLTNSAWDSMADAVGDDLLIRVGGNYFAMALNMKDDDVNRALIADLGRLSRGERRRVSTDYALPHSGGVIWFHLEASPVGRSGRIVITHTDVTARVLAERASSWRARHDHLTGLPNRAHLHELIDAELQRPERPRLAVLFLDVDGFKDVNDSLSHDVGDELLRELAGRLTQSTRAEDTVGRLGGDEFVVLCRDCDPEDAELLAGRFQATFDRPFQLGAHTVRLSASIGIAVVDGSGGPELRSTDLVRDADLAMYAAKEAGRNRVRHFTPDLRSAVQQKVQLAAELRGAIDGDQLVLHYQPIRHLQSGEFSGVEALVRWQHPERGLLPPSEFVALAEQHELIVPLTRWVLATATRQAAAWDAAGLPLVVGVNISAHHFAAGTLQDDVAAALEEAGLPPERLVLELTETSVAEDPERAAAQFAGLRRSGVEVSIDDFGQGFSSLSQLISLPVGMLKIDRSLVVGADGPTSAGAAAIAAVVGLASAFGMRTLAEGVETAEQLAVATELGCAFAQGYHLARPMPADQLVEWMHARELVRTS
ncbi:EAL domain-containing protein [Blastococcus sp. CCUG 61487]|uniref:putative bifunctional diguanylate cyclase/phosphodiesterase n=1 Tax=Blastococcus sp. CCUG 61487 TaxID=1840703 RepID=UPI001134A036|nr:EAL domain-containing protein [Blastococcus sp. CCUG 61487]TKJ18496.1 diguanylate cyclase [Blastococcus sp. CCUG 61487]